MAICGPRWPIFANSCQNIFNNWQSAIVNNRPDVGPMSGPMIGPAFAKYWNNNWATYPGSWCYPWSVLGTLLGLLGVLSSGVLGDRLLSGRTEHHCSCGAELIYVGCSMYTLCLLSSLPFSVLSLVPPPAAGSGF